MRKPPPAYVSNPARPGALRPVHLITDRAKRYRAQKNAPASSNPRCYMCGAPRPRDIEHIDGNEADDSPDNLHHACRSCNTTKGVTFARNGFGTRTRQYNPGKGKKRATPRKAARKTGAKTMAQYVQAVMVVKGQSNEMELPDAVQLLRDTPPEDRSAFAREIWSRRRKRLK